MSDHQEEPTHKAADFFGPPPLLRGEDEAPYQALLAEVERMIEPKTVLDRIDVRDITDKIWEGQRYKRLEPRLIESACVSAPEVLVPIFELDHSRALEAANMYYSREGHKHKVAAKLLADHEITDEMILAKALARVGSHVSNIDRLIVARERSRQNLFKDHQRRRENAKKLAQIEQATINEVTSPARVRHSNDAAQKYPS